MLPIRLSEAQVEDLFVRTGQYPGYKLTANLETCRLSDSHGLDIEFEVEPFRRRCLLQGLDDIGSTLKHEDKITAYEQTLDRTR